MGADLEVVSSLQQLHNYNKTVARSLRVIF